MRITLILQSVCTGFDITKKAQNFSNLRQKLYHRHLIYVAHSLTKKHLHVQLSSAILQRFLHLVRCVICVLL
jgi:hypothetical protein